MFADSDSDAVIVTLQLLWNGGYYSPRKEKGDGICTW